MPAMIDRPMGDTYFRLLRREALAFLENWYEN